MIHLSPSAASEIRRLQANAPSRSYLRLGVQSGGCAGWAYTIDFDAQMRSSDRALESQGIALLVDEQHWLYLKDLILDYSEDLMGGGFRFTNPNATQTCGCSHSFTVDTST
ncbi:iron-sulfur cluster assembly accessory protein [Desertifilum sp. FACHB-1129]|uniref:Core domain-containing protein n=2 Tax=Desertifilum tharense IPPAS B-1220 TaxID=1781255 RepID=A0A1E5QCK6_9CYAN|nr:MULTISPECIES: iron-sulfur cluster assembly accessory protein [Desertifilum]MCD8486626.1 iron-sulfur cluster assembly accessory protein [Desertifilum sp.]MDA0210868.1 iron-sulfur cluster assembly accessory protein [Cyanobacteria bacterium FC1]MBD2312101.1 iron-sulfur cluster assembly accessory protein [Desertifilum sp. FACHB-1129]MBD2322238.1 iron-sulfur cluster assembly accessory protein [Desertifilum sp. FACHB-866]MBD2332275.1 iron-sulfur cluster assembly accessory protein [Desertifilum sp